MQTGFLNQIVNHHIVKHLEILLTFYLYEKTIFTLFTSQIVKSYPLLANSTCFSGHHQVSLLRGGPQVNKFEQVSSVDHQLSAGGGTGTGGGPSPGV